MCAQLNKSEKSIGVRTVTGREVSLRRHGNRDYKRHQTERAQDTYVKDKAVMNSTKGRGASLLDGSFGGRPLHIYSRRMFRSAVNPTWTQRPMHCYALI